MKDGVQFNVKEKQRTWILIEMKVCLEIVHSDLGWEFIKEKKKVSKQENTHSSKKIRTRPRKQN